MQKQLILLALLSLATPLAAEDARSFDAAAAFGARPSVSGMTLSPDGQSVAYIAPTDGQGSMAYTLSLVKGSSPRLALRATGKPERLGSCAWVAGDRLVCTVYASVKDPTVGFLPFTRVVAVNADGSNFQLLSRRDTFYQHGKQLGGGQVIDYLPEENGAVLMTRVYVPDDKIGSRFGSNNRGLGVDWLDTRNLTVKSVEPPRPTATEYISDGRGTVRIMGIQQGSGTGTFMYQEKGVVEFLYRRADSRDWQHLSDFNYVDNTGFDPYAVDPDLNVAYGVKKLDGRLALYSVALDGSLREELVYANPNVDVNNLVRIGRQRHVVGVNYITDVRHAEYFTPQIKQLRAALVKALPQEPLLRIADSSSDEATMLVFAGADDDPGVYYIFDRKAHQLQTFLVVRAALEGVKLANVRSVSYPGPDGVMVPAYLTLPPGTDSARGLPAIVLPHGGPSARDEWGFDWLSQFYASCGFAVLQPNFRGSSGYGDAWFEKNGFRSWQLAINDVLAGGRWLVSQGIADPAKLGIVGWSYGGYAALQSAVVDPAVFKAVVAIAPVTDLAELKEQYRHWSSYVLASEFIGEGPHVRDASPAQHAERIKVPVLIFHGGFDRNVSIEESRLMCARLTAAGGKCELVSWDDLDHYLDDSAARTQMLRRSNEFLHTALGMTH
jgi:acetyl esterase/lipase